jgi:hypothetical protein
MNRRQRPDLIKYKMYAGLDQEPSGSMMTHEHDMRQSSGICAAFNRKSVSPSYGASPVRPFHRLNQVT